MRDRRREISGRAFDLAVPRDAVARSQLLLTSFGGHGAHSPVLRHTKSPARVDPVTRVTRDSAALAGRTARGDRGLRRERDKAVAGGSRRRSLERTRCVVNPGGSQRRANNTRRLTRGEARLMVRLVSDLPTNWRRVEPYPNGEKRRAGSPGGGQTRERATA